MTTPAADTSGVWLDLVAATDYLSATHRLGMTIWEAVEEAIRWWTTDRLTLPGELPDGAFTELPWGDDPDPLRTSVERLLASTSEAAAPTAWSSGRSSPPRWTRGCGGWPTNTTTATASRTPRRATGGRHRCTTRSSATCRSSLGRNDHAGRHERSRPAAAYVIARSTALPNEVGCCSVRIAWTVTGSRASPAATASCS